MQRTIKGSSMVSLIGILCLSIALVITIGACSSSDTTDPTPTPTATTAVEEATPTPEPTATPRPTPEPLSLTITTPENQSSVDIPEIEVAGETLLTAIVSVNGELVDVEADGTFSTTITLDEGINNIEIVASHLDGTEELSEILMVAYMPQ